jgi:glycosyltransferase involved in cell wall biosynthesis
LRICFLIPGFSDGGAQKQCAFLLNALQRYEGVDVTLIYMHPGVHDNLIERSGITIRRLEVRSNYDPRNVLRLRSMLSDIKPDILMTWMHACDVYGFFLKRAWYGMRWVMSERDSSYPVDPRYLLRALLGRRADAIAANSQKGADYWHRLGAKCPIFIFPNIVQPAPLPQPATPPTRVCMIGRLEPQKNVRTVVTAFCLLAKQRPDISFAVIGDGGERGVLQDIVARHDAQDHVAFLGFRTDITDQIATSHCIVSMSNHEGMPNVMLESISGNIAPVVSDIPEHRELLGPDYPHYVQDRNDPEAVAKAITSAIDAPHSDSVLNFARERLAVMTPERISADYLDLFRHLAGE